MSRELFCQQFQCDNGFNGLVKFTRCFNGESSIEMIKNKTFDDRKCLKKEKKMLCETFRNICEVYE